MQQRVPQTFFVSISTNRLRNQGVYLQKQFCFLEKDKQCRIETWNKSNFSLLLTIICTSHTFSLILDSMVVSIPACHAGDRGSIPRRGDSFYICCFTDPWHKTWCDWNWSFFIPLYSFLYWVTESVLTKAKYIEMQ